MTSETICSPLACPACRGGGWVLCVLDEAILAELTAWQRGRAGVGFHQEPCRTCKGLGRAEPLDTHGEYPPPPRPKDEQKWVLVLNSESEKKTSS